MGERICTVTIAALVLLVGAGARGDDTPVKAPKTFEEALDAAEPAGDLADRFDPLFADCKRDDDLDARQCAAVRDAALARLNGTQLVALGDESSLTWTPWTSGEKQIGLELHGCLACGKPLLLGDPPKPRFVTVRVPKAIRAGQVAGLDVGFYGVSQPSKGAAARFVKDTMPHLVTQFVFRVGPVWKSGGYDGITFVPVAQRIFDRCTGKVYASEPPSAKPAVAQPDKSCPAQPVADEVLPEQLSRDQVVKTMRTVEPKIHSCYLALKKEGTVQVRLVLDGSGRLDGLQVGAPFDGTPSGECVKKAVSSASFGRFTGEKMTIIYPFMLR